MKPFDRDLARGPWPLAPVPSFLADAGAGLTFQLVWAAALAAAFAALCGAALWLDPALVSPRVVELVAQGSVPTLLFAVGAAVAFARGGFDFTVGPVAVFAALVAIQGESAALGLAAALGFGLLVGLVVAFARVPGWLVTLVGLFVLRPKVFAAVPDGLLQTLDRLPAWTPRATAALLLLAAVGAFALVQLGPRPPRARSWGARLADGVPYVLSAGLAGAAGLFTAHRNGVLTGAYFTLTWIEVLAAVVLGGTWLGSGRPNVLGTVVAVFVLRVLSFMLAWRAVSPYVEVAAWVAIAVLGAGISIAAHAARARRFARPPPAPAAALGAPPAPPAG